ncbi:MAG: hypothetical protein AABW51_00035 [Nanoarchaeota archaeon]
MKSKSGAMEMSVGTLVTIVLLMAVLILGIFLVRKIFVGSSDAIDSVNNQLNDQINKLFTEDNAKKLVVLPDSRSISLKKGDDPKGFAFSVRNSDVEQAEFTYDVTADDVSKCGSSFTQVKADNYLLGGTGKFNLGPGNSLDQARLVKFQIPDTAPPCTIIYDLEVKKDGVSYSGANVFVTIK